MKGALNLALPFVRNSAVNLVGMEGDLGTLKTLESKRLCLSTEQVEHEELQAPPPLTALCQYSSPLNSATSESKSRSSFSKFPTIPAGLYPKVAFMGFHLYCQKTSV